MALGFGALGRRRKWLVLALVLGGLAALSACGSSTKATTPVGTPAGVYTLTFTGSSASTTHISTATLNVN